MAEQTGQRLLAAVLEIGEQMLLCGGEVSRVEDTMTRILKSYGAERVDVFVITSSMVVTVCLPGGEVQTQTRRIHTYRTDFGMLEDLNALSREICLEKPELEELLRRIARAKAGGRNLLALPTFGSALAAGSFAIFFGGSALDGAAAALIGSGIYLADRYFRPLLRSQLVFYLLAAFLTGCLSALFSRLGPTLHLDMIMIGCIMLLIPGIAMTNAFRDMLSGDTISGTLRLLETLLVAATLACGFVGALMLCGRSVA